MTLVQAAQHRLHNAACALFFGTNNTDTRDTYHTALDALTAALHEEGGTWPTSAPTPSSTSDTSTTPR
jgi:hypothetical protein